MCGWYSVGVPKRTQLKKMITIRHTTYTEKDLISFGKSYARSKGLVRLLLSNIILEQMQERLL
jgi:hypothetical protein